MAKKEIKESNKKNHYFKDMKVELKKVVWPTPKQLINNTVAVILFTIIIAVIVFILDICFDSLNKYGITVLQEKIQSSYNSYVEEKNDNEDTENKEQESEENKNENEENSNESSEENSNIDVKETESQE